MAASVKTSGSQTAVISTEHTLATVTDAGTYALAVDLTNMAAGDRVELRIYGKCRSTDAETLIDYFSAIGPQGQPLNISHPRLSPHYYKVTLKQTAGTGRAFPWAIYQT